MNDPQYKEYFKSNSEIWNDTLKIIIDHINQHHSLPTNKNNQYLCSWIKTQQHNYKNKKKIMKNEIIYNKWTEFINDLQYKQYFAN